ncbi:peptidoglycan DD-metalloendopeptidase family protein [Streptomyces genisteinicus]|nr:peptidoglycan DD-metalloendopeptidase family protein [Streptomyces genisteinicus]
MCASSRKRMIILPVVLGVLIGTPAPVAAEPRPGARAAATGEEPGPPEEAGGLLRPTAPADRRTRPLPAAARLHPAAPLRDDSAPGGGTIVPPVLGVRPGTVPLHGPLPGDLPPLHGLAPLPWAAPPAPPAPDAEADGAEQRAPAPRRAAPDGPRATAVTVARLYAEASRASQQYERGRRAADTQRAAAGRLQRGLADRRARLERLHDVIGGVAREQYRTGGSLAGTARLLLADDPDTLLRGYELAARTERAVNRLLDRSRTEERRYAEAERKARAAWQALAARTARLASVKRGIEAKLEAARWQLQGEADSSVAAGSCAGAVRLDQPALPRGAGWVAPVEHYALSAGFASTGDRWARGHTGQDFAVDIGTPVRSVGPGVVESVACGGAFGIEIVVRHDNGYWTQYAHLAGVGVDQGERVRAGQWIGQAGTTGNSTGPHLHFEVRLTPDLGSGVDPAAWLREHGVRL